MEAHKLHYQIRCSHHEMELAGGDSEITCPICGKVWHFSDKRGYRKHRKVYFAEKNE